MTGCSTLRWRQLGRRDGTNQGLLVTSWWQLRTSLALRRVLNKTSLPFQNPPKFKQIQVKFFQVVARKESLMIGISLAAGATFVWFVSLPADQLLHHPRMNPTGAIAAEAQRVQERFEQERNAEIDASIAAVAARRAQERFEQKRNAEIDASIAAITNPWMLFFAGSFAQVDGPEQPWQP